jgi:tRNA modification GTPase
MSITEDTIAAIATAPGGAIGMIRISGTDAIRLGQTHFYPWPKKLLDRHLYHGWWRDKDGQDIDEGLIVTMKGPRSYTGEDVVELSVHGGALGLSHCLDACVASGARLAEPGEFTRRAFLNGRLDLTRAEGVADLIAAQTERALKQARSLLKGELYERANQIRTTLLSLRARIEVNIDFVEEDVPVIDTSILINESRAIATQLRDLSATYHLGRLARDGARIAIIGRPNAGKSSLFNALCKHERAIVTDVAGTTRDTLEEKIDIAGIPVTLIDTAGLREAPDLVEKLGVERTLEEVKRADLVLQVIDGPEPDEDGPTLPPDVPMITIASKADLNTTVPKSARLSFSSKTGTGLQELMDACRDQLGGTFQETSGLVLTRKRQQVAVEHAADAVSEVLEGLGAGQPTELVAVDLQEALDALGELVGATSIEDVLDHLFAEFCIGK